GRSSGQGKSRGSGSWVSDPLLLGEIRWKLSGQGCAISATSRVKTSSLTERCTGQTPLAGNETRTSPGSGGRLSEGRCPHSPTERARRGEVAQLALTPSTTCS